MEAIIGGLTSFFWNLLAKPLARAVLIGLAAAAFSGVLTTIVVVFCYILYTWFLRVLKYLALIGLYLSIFAATVIYMKEDTETWDQLLVDPTLGWNVTRTYWCRSVRLVTERSVWQCPATLPSNATDMTIIYV